MTERLPSSLPDITPRQREVAGYIAQGLTNEEIATRLGITHDDAKYHVSELLSRLGLQRREEVAEWYRATPAPRSQLRGLLAIPLLKPALGIGGAALIALLLVVTLTSNTIRGGGNPTHAEALTGPLPEEGWDISLSPDYRDTDFIVVVQSTPYVTGLPDRGIARIHLVDPDSGLIAATVRVSARPNVFSNAGAAIRPDARELIVYQGGDGLTGDEHQLLVFDLAANLALKRAIRVPPSVIYRTGYLPLTLSADGRRLIFQHTVTNADIPTAFASYLVIVDLDQATVETVEMEPGCTYGNFLPRDDGNTMVMGHTRCQYDVLLFNSTGSAIRQWRWDFMGEHVGYNITSSFVAAGGQLARLRHTGHLELLDSSGTTIERPSYWPGGLAGWGFSLPGDRLITRVTYHHHQPSPIALQTDFVVFNIGTFQVDHRIQSTDSYYTSYQIRPDENGIWALRMDGGIDSIDWDGSITPVPHARFAPHVPGQSPTFHLAHE